MVVVDDGSSDPDTHRALDQLEAEGVTIVRQPNRGVSAARMAGVAGSTAPYVQSLDSDDQMAPDVIGPWRRCLMPTRTSTWSGVTSNRSVSAVRLGHLERLRSVAADLPQRGPGRRHVPPHSLIEVGGWEVTGYEDWDLFLKGADHGWRGARIDAVSVRYRQQATTRRLDLLHAADEQNRAELRRRHTAFFAARRANRRRSTSTAR